MSLNLKYSTVGQGEHLVFLHGWGVNSGVWSSLVPLLEKDYTITCIDLPGFGQNHDQLPSVYDLDNIGKCVADVLPEKCRLIGWSLGGLVAQQIALTCPEKLQQLVLICSSPKFSKSQDWPGIQPQVLEAFTQQLKHDFSKTLERFLAIQAMGSNTARQDVKTMKQAIEAYPQPSVIALEHGLNLLHDCDLRAELANLLVPCHGFLGRLDSLVPAEIGASLERFSSRITTQTLSKASHAPFISHTSEFAEQLKTILN
ncbi:pimeloyl-ACP methyl ester esterase BioH [Paraglaciecola aquimarina]|uniref:Pimeloyl-[acyl-carrier protein] methyl ester esterase n=1 Tax=Paraglaciecola algarum TaxID=3050085 RepID=A0ABS9DD63_9ALTE|nr:pimeloyl-ACP methyl ester esterase BioH [Paraglaciecola sp. G1-23]MCF2950295.1 pimeloyl-ACP methyl ester esterase BioH [Paraglaciecola sp. G1-23]